jgi:hypothetical protein
MEGLEGEEASQGQQWSRRERVEEATDFGEEEDYLYPTQK